MIELNAQAFPYTEADLDLTLPQRFAQVVERFAEREAIWDADGHLMTYAELDAASNRVANALLARTGAGAQPIGVLMAHRTPTLAALIGIYKAGKISLILDTQQPPARLRESLSDASAPLLLVDATTLGQAKALDMPLLPVEEALSASAAPVQQTRSADDPMSIYYTSGSTGKPKGVVRSARARLYGVILRSQIGRLTHLDRNLGIGSISFSGSFTALFMPLMSGARLHMVDAIQDGLNSIIDCLRQQAITVYFSTPTIFRAWAPLIDAPLPALRMIKTGGEAVRDSDAAHFKRITLPGAEFNVTLASSEGGLMTSITYTHDSIIPQGVLPVGYPTPGKEILIVDEAGLPMPPGEAGEIALRSKLTASGYLNRAELTAERFRKDGENTLLLTGDLGRMDADGCVYHLGRKDTQIKINGQRVELGEVEAVLVALPEVKAAAVVPMDDLRGEKTLTAYVVPHDTTNPPTAAAIRDALRERLTSVMIPAQIAFLTELPINANGKLDLQKLIKPNASQTIDRTRIELPNDEIERELVEIWENALKMSPIGTHDDFFTIGGHSLLMAHVFAQIETKFGRVLPLTIMLEEPTIAGLAGRIRANADIPFSPLVPIQPGEPGRPALFCFHAAQGFIKLYRDFLPFLDPAMPVYGLQAKGLDARTEPMDDLAAMASLYIQAIRSVQPAGPYHLMGYSFGGFLAVEAARQLADAGERVGFVGMIDSTFRSQFRSPLAKPMRPPLKYARHAVWTAQNLVEIPMQYKPVYLWRFVNVVGRRLGVLKAPGKRIMPPPLPLPPRVIRVRDASYRSITSWQTKPYRGHLDFFFAQANPFDLRLFRGLRRVSTGNYTIHFVPGTHGSMILEPEIQVLGAAVRRALDAKLLDQQR
jgi:amino acid adenylation domain-containing protein